MKIFSFFSLALLGLCSVGRSEPQPETGLVEYEMVGLVSDLVTGVLDALGGEDAIKNAIMAVVGQIGTERRLELGDVDSTEIFGDDAEAKISEVVENWLDDLPEELLANGDRRRLQSEEELIVRFLVCTLMSIFHANIMYSQVEDLDDYDDNFVCLKKNECPGLGLENVKFVSDNADGNEFLYHDKGPEALQGVFWLNYAGYCSSMVSFAETVEEYPLSTGELREPVFPLFPGLPEYLTYDGYAYNVRVSGASNWAFSGGSFCYPIVEAIDLIYGIKPNRQRIFCRNQRCRKLNTIDDPTSFVIVPTIKTPFTDIYVSLDSECTVDTFYTPSALLRFEMTLIEDCDDINVSVFPSGQTAKDACDAGAVIWERNSWFLQNIYDPPLSTYYVIQIVDGCGKKTAAYNDFVNYEAGGWSDPYPTAEFRSLKATKAAKAAKTCKKKGR